MRDWKLRSGTAALVVILAGCSAAGGAEGGASVAGERVAQAASAVTAAEQAKLFANDKAADDAFGRSLAVRGERAVIGAPYGDTLEFNAGKAYVFGRGVSGWAEEVKLVADGGLAEDRFGWSVAVADDTVVVGAPRRDDKGSDSGAAYVFVRTSTGWLQQAKLLGADLTQDDEFGMAVAVSGDTALVGAQYRGDQGALSGAVYVFTRSGATWTEQAKLTAKDAAAEAEFGNAIAIEGDTALIGAYRDDQRASDAGAAYVFTRAAGVWSQTGKLVAADGEADDYFGCSVALSGGRAVVGAEQGGSGGVTTGAAYAFALGTAGWAQEAKLVPAGAAAGDHLGTSVALSGNVAAVGAYGRRDLGMTSGAAYVFARDAVGWSEGPKLLASDGIESDELGTAVGVTQGAVLAGAPGVAIGTNYGVGAAYAYTLAEVPANPCVTGCGSGDVEDAGGCSATPRRSSWLGAALLAGMVAALGARRRRAG